MLSIQSIPLCVDTAVSSHRLLYAHRYFCTFIILHFLSATSISLRFINWTPGKGYFIIKGNFMHGNSFCWPKNSIDSSSVTFVPYLRVTVKINMQWKPKEYDKNLHATKITHKTVEMYLKYTNTYMQFSEITFLILRNTESKYII